MDRSPLLMVILNSGVPFPARSAKRQCRIDLVLDPDERVEHHRPAIVEVDLIGVEARIAARIGVVTIDLESLQTRGARRPWPGPSLLDA